MRTGFHARRFLTLGVLATALGIATLVPAGASADPQPFGIYVNDHGTDSAAAWGTDVDDRLTVTTDPTSFILDSPVGFQAGYGCNGISATQARCDRYSSDIDIRTFDGDDHVTLRGRGVHGSVSAGPGADVLNGSAGKNGLYGDLGDDLIRGGRDDDEISGDEGVDRLLGGHGDDILYALGDGRDDRIDCGPGKDVAYVDRRDPGPLRCEKVRFEY